MTDRTDLLDRILPRPCHTRPFICEGFPDQQDVVVVGENPATQMDADWWEYWRPHGGFDRNRFMEDYRKRRPVLRGTRARLERMKVEHGLRVLETNIANERIDGAGRNPTDNAWLLRLVVGQDIPVIVHGKKAQRAVSLGFPELKSIPTRHFSRISFDELDRLSSDLRL